MRLHILMHRDVLPLFPPFPSCSWVLPGVTSIPRSLFYVFSGPFTLAACINTSSNHPITFFICSLRYVSAHVIVGHACFALCMVSLPIFVTQIIHKFPLWSHLLGSTMTLSVHRPQSFIWTANVDPMEMIERFLQVSSCLFLYFFWWASKVSCCTSSLSVFTGILFICGKRLHIVAMNSIMVRLGVISVIKLD